MYCITFYLILSTTIIMCDSNCTKIAIIGGGIGGTSCAYFIRELLNDNISIDLYEACKIGGRIASEKILNKWYFESGGSVIHSSNRYMTYFVEKFNLKVKTMPSDTLGIYDGNKFVFVESESQCSNYVKLLWNYGLDLLKLRRFIQTMLESFENIYGLQADKQSFTNVFNLLNTLDPTLSRALTTSVTDAFLVNQNYNLRIVNELMYAANRVNYGQNNSIHEFVGSVSLAGAAGDLWAVDGCNYLVALELLKQSSAKFINKKVDSVELLASNQTKFKVNCGNHSNVYDFVVCATPLTNDAQFPIRFLNFPTEIYVPGTYHTTICTFVVGKLNTEFFNDNECMPDSVCTINEKLIFNSISLLNRNGDNSVYKVFSNNILTEDQLNELFKPRKSVKVINWLAYPSYSTTPRNDSFVLFNKLYYINAIEWAASSIEMSTIGAKNVAILIHKYLKNCQSTARPIRIYNLSVIALLLYYCY